MTAPEPAEVVAEVLSRHLGRGARVGVAVSGGSDSLALLHLARLWAKNSDAVLRVATVDHALREGSAAEAAQVAAIAGELGLPHARLEWRDWDGQGNLQDRARAARSALLSDWARAHDLTAILLGHTRDDQAETFLMRLARGSGVDGLAAMAEARSEGAFVWLRPMLGLRRAALRDWLRAHGHAWVEDPSNEDPRFDRVRLRRMLPDLQEIGLSVDRLADTAETMSRARAALLARARDCAERLCTVRAGTVLFDMPGLSALEDETRLRLVAHALQWTASQPYRPRLASLTATWEQVAAGQTASLHGCLLIPWRGTLVVAREYAAVASHAVGPGAMWDGRWRLDADDATLRVAPLGEAGVRMLDERPDDLPYAALPPLPGLWKDERLLAVPALSWGLSGQIYTSPDKTSFLAGLIPH